jgi:hypothetical protein
MSEVALLCMNNFVFSFFFKTSPALLNTLLEERQKLSMTNCFLYFSIPNKQYLVGKYVFVGVYYFLAQGVTHT